MHNVQKPSMSLVVCYDTYVQVGNTTLPSPRRDRHIDFLCVADYIVLVSGNRLCCYHKDLLTLLFGINLISSGCRGAIVYAGGSALLYSVGDNAYFVNMHNNERHIMIGEYTILPHSRVLLDKRTKRLCEIDLRGRRVVSYDKFLYPRLFVFEPEDQVVESTRFLYSKGFVIDKFNQHQVRFDTDIRFDTNPGSTHLIGLDDGVLVEEDGYVIGTTIGYVYLINNTGMVFEVPVSGEGVLYDINHEPIYLEGFNSGAYPQINGTSRKRVKSAMS